METHHIVEIESASFDYSRDQNKIENKIPVVSVSDRGKRIANYSTCSCIYTVDYEIKGDRGKMLGKTIEVGNVPLNHVSGALRMLAQLPEFQHICRGGQK